MNFTNKRVIVYVWEAPDYPQSGLMDELVRFAKDDLHMTVVKQYIDRTPDQYSERPAYRKLLAMIHNHRTDFVLVNEITQIARSIKNLAYFATVLKANDVDLLCIKDAIDTITPERKSIFFSVIEALSSFTPDDRKLFFNIVSEIALFEKDNREEKNAERSEAIRAGMLRAQNEGKKLGRPGLSDAKVTRLVEMMLQGKSQKDIVLELKISRITYKKYALAAEEFLPKTSSVF